MAYSNIENLYLTRQAEQVFPTLPEEPQGEEALQLAAGPARTMSDAGRGMPTIKPLPQTTLERALEQTGLTLEQAGRFLDSLGQVDVPLLGKVSLADFVPFVGSAKEGSRSVLAPAEWQGTPKTLQQMGTGVGSMVDRVTTGTGMARQLNEDAKLAAMDVATNIVPVAKVTAKAATKTARALAPKAGEMLGQYMERSGLQPSLVAYHGTPHNFDKFSASKIGSGEGAQAYGFGLYFAETRGVADEYRVRLSYDPEQMKVGGRQINQVYSSIENKAAKMPPAQAQVEYEKLDLLERLMMNESVDDLQQALSDMTPATKTWFDKTVRPSFETYGNLYTVDIPDEMVAKMLDFDAPISSQSQEIQALARQYNLQPEDLGGDLLAAADGKTAAGAQRLREAGIPGVRYLDQGSRGQREGTRNIVVFPGGEDQVQILKKEGKQ